MVHGDRPRRRLIGVVLDAASIGRGAPDQEHEREIAIRDLIDRNSFGLPDRDGGPYRLRVGLRDTNLVLDIRDERDQPIVAHNLSLAPFRRVLRDYFMICDTYYAAIGTATPERIEAIDMGRRAAHDDGARLVAERLKGKAICDLDTARGLFTLLAALHRRG